ncbi:sigma-70 family RNA polymerase sigma factor [Staphylococcus auricularis]|uniref:sigma-70 family RNA polymerase sigma factor n=1 Tax=Staphylococcus auricularis TaxID=29379 RepID=UPI00248F3F4D|nr:sigma-70 family RNA polymerase sigma factor [Staphylococcus auricularis]
MNFDYYYEKHHKIIHYLLKKYRINYNYDEYYQQLLIKFWELLQHYHPQKANSLPQYLFTRLNFHLIDLFRKQSTLSNHNESISQALMHGIHTTNMQSVETSLSYIQFSQQLNPREREVLRLKLAGYTHKEIAHMLGCSVCSIKYYKQAIKKKYLQFLQSQEV